MPQVAQRAHKETVDMSDTDSLLFAERVRSTKNYETAADIFTDLGEAVGGDKDQQMDLPVRCAARQAAPNSDSVEEFLAHTRALD